MNQIGMESHKRAVISLLNIESEDVRMVAICGMGGIGKTTIAKTVYKEIGRSFRYCAILENVRETCRESSQKGLLKLQRKLLSRMGNKTREILDVDEGAHIIEKKCCNCKTLLVIDDVSHGDQLEKLVGSCDWFGPWSKIIVTTRDKSVLQYRKEMKSYEVPRMEDADAYRLFIRTAFQDNDNTEAYEEIINAAVKFAQGLPLAIEVLGGLFRSKPQNEWDSTLRLLNSCPPCEILDLLKESYESLNDKERVTFLDIACFLRGQPERHVRDVLECCDLEPVSVMGVLERKYLISIENKKVNMNNWLQEMGREIVRKESNKIRKRSRLWDSHDIRDILTGETEGTEKIQGMKMELHTPEVVALREKAFKPLKRLRLFQAYRTQYSGNPIELPKKLRCLEWEGYSSSSLPLNGSADCELAGLYMRESKIRSIDHELKLFRNLRFLYLSKSTMLIKIPDVSSLPMLEILDAEGCTGLQEVHESLGELTKLVCLNFLNCQKLHTFPTNLKSNFLEALILKGCSNLSRFPDIDVTMDKLKQLSIDKTKIDELPSSIGNLIKLEVLCLRGCKRLNTIPKSIYRLQSLQRVSLDDCCKLDEFPEYVDGYSGSPSTQNPSLFPNVAHIDLPRCSLCNINFMRNLECTSTLRSLDLSGNKLIEIPEFIVNFSAMQVLHLENCKELLRINGLPSNIRELHAEGCESLEHCVPLSSFSKSDSVHSLLLFSGCHKLRQNDSSVAIRPSIEGSTLKSEVKILHPGSEIPQWFAQEMKSKMGLITFSVNSEEYKNIAGMALCMIIGLDGLSEKIVSCEMQVDINSRRAYYSHNCFYSLSSDHMWLVYVPCHMISGWDNEMISGCNKFEVKFGNHQGYLNCCVVHLVLKKDIETTNQLNHYASGADHQSLESLPGPRSRALEDVARPQKMIRYS